MNDQRMVDVGLLRPFVALLQAHNDQGDDSRPVFAINDALITIGDLRKLRAIISGPGVEPVAKWIDGTPPFPQNQEWFIAITTYGDKVVLRALPEEYAYDYKTADDTYIKAANIRCWMQFPDCEYLPPKSAPSAPVQAVPDWQPIETAPKGPLLLFANQFDGIGDWRIKVGFWDGHECRWHVFGGSWTPTHWMPLPQPPNDSTAQSSAVACPTDRR